MASPKRSHEMLQEQWGKAIRARRGDRSQTWLAERINVDQTTVSRLERGVYRLTPELMLSIAAALDAELEDLFQFPKGLVSREQYEQENRRLRVELATAKGEVA